MGFAKIYQIQTRSVMQSGHSRAPELVWQCNHDGIVRELCAPPLSQQRPHHHHPSHRLKAAQYSTGRVVNVIDSPLFFPQRQRLYMLPLEIR